jgi:hypothetical protein
VWEIVSSFSLHNLQTGFTLKMPMVCRCFHRLQWPVISPVMTLICVLLNRRQHPLIWMVCPSLACSVCDLPCWSNVSGESLHVVSYLNMFYLLMHCYWCTLFSQLNVTGIVCITGVNKMAWLCIGLDQNTYQYVFIAAGVGWWCLVDMALYQQIPYEIT